jgi:hypothetical protein
MVNVIEFPLDNGGMLGVQAVDADVLPGPVLASRGEQLLKASESLEQSLQHIVPALTAVTNRLHALSPDQLSVEFGLILTAETGVVVAKGGAEVHFTVSLAWSRSHGDVAEHTWEEPVGATVHDDGQDTPNKAQDG